MHRLNNLRDRSTYGTANMIKILSKHAHGLKICHINAQSLAPKIEEFRYIFENSNMDIVCVSETWFHASISNLSVSLSGYNLIRVDRVGRAGGVAIYIRRGISYNIKSTSNDYNVDGDNNDGLVEYVLIEVISRGRKLLVGSLYRPNNNIPIEPFFSILENFTALYNDVVLVGDFNWNLLTDSSIIDILAPLGLFPTNITTPTHFTSSNSTLIDLLFVGNVSNVILYDQLSAPCFSKHDLLFMTYNFQLQIPPYSITFRDFENVKYATLELELLRIDWNAIYYMVSTEDKLAFLERNILYLFDQAVPLKTKVMSQTKRPWFSSNIKQAIKQRDLAFSRWKRFKTNDLHVEYCLARKTVHKLIKQEKSKFYTEKFSLALGSKKTWKAIREIGIGKSGNNDPVIFDPDVINEQFLNIPMVEADIDFYNHNHDNRQPHNNFSFDCIDQFDVLRSCMSIKSNAVGVDEIHPRFFKLILPRILPFVTHVFNTIITTSHFPSNWKKSKIIPIPKTKSEYRPIAILPFMSKIFERLIHNQISLYVNDHNLLNDKQSGFRKNHSCITALVDVAEDIRNSIDERKTNILVLLDHSKAFDTVDHNVLCYKLKHMFMFSTAATRLISTYLTNRYQYVQSGNNKSKFLPVTRGVPQGSIIGPLLFSLYADDLPSQLTHCKVRMYADDVQIYISCDTSEIEQCVLTLNTELKHIYEWATANGLSINPKKSKYLVIQKRSTITDHIPDIFLGDERIERVNTAKNLGIIFNKNLTWGNHINYACGRTYSMLRTLWQTQYCTPVKIRILLAKTYLLPILMYGCELFAKCDAASTRKLNSVFKSIVRYVYGVKRFNSVSPFTVKLYGVQFDDLLKTRVLIFMHKIVFTQQPQHLYNRLTISRSNRGKRILLFRHQSLTSDWQFFLNAIRLWNLLPHNIQITSNALSFKKSILNFFAR